MRYGHYERSAYQYEYVYFTYSYLGCIVDLNAMLHMEKNIWVKNMFKNRLNMGLLWWTWVEKTAHEVETLAIMLTIFRDVKESETVGFLENDATVNNASFC